MNGKPPFGVAGKNWLPEKSFCGMVLRSVSLGAIGVFVHGSAAVGPTHGTGAVGLLVLAVSVGVVARDGYHDVQGSL